MYHIRQIKVNKDKVWAVYGSYSSGHDEWIATFKYNADAHNYCKSAHDGSEYVEVDEQGGKVSYYAHPL